MSLSEKAKAKARAFRRALLAAYRRGARDLPWRRTREPYRIWLAEIMLQQTRVETVVPYYKRFLEAFPTMGDLAAAREDRVLKLWEGLGYYSRARNLHRAAKEIVKRWGGEIPRTAAELESLPGIGRYTAGAVASIAFGERAPVVDGNVKRVLARVFAIRDSIDAPATVGRLWEAAAVLLAPRDPGAFNQALMEHGARLCVPRHPRCGRCPVRQLCDAHALGIQDKLPRRRAKKASPHFEAVAAAIEKNGRFLIGKRPPGGLLGGLWELPGGKVEPGETHEQALAREIDEELGARIAVSGRVAAIEHAYSHFKVTLHVYRCTLAGPPPHRRHYAELKWAARSQFARYAFPAATRKALALL
jgi:A/G-specific adenine glycosylase